MNNESEIILDIIRDFAKYKLTPELSDRILTIHNIGKLVLTTGKLVACDPLVYPEEPFTPNLRPDRYPVFLCVVHIPKRNDQIIAYALVSFSKNKPVRWELATLPEQDITTLEEDEIFGYPVDSGTGCFMDAEVSQILLDDSWSNEYEESLGYQLEEALEKNHRDGRDWADFVVNEATQANVIAFRSGWGDGIYPSYFGCDADDRIAVAITDFEL